MTDLVLPAAVGSGQPCARDYRVIETDGVMRFYVHFEVEAHEMREWQPDRIAQFFRGIAVAIQARSSLKADAMDVSLGQGSGLAPAAGKDESGAG